MVIVLGIWRGIGKFVETGFRVIAQTGGDLRVFFDGGSLPGDTKTARENERWRELARLLYVTLTRPRVGLIVPWAADFGGRQRERPSFAELWGGAAVLDALPEILMPEGSSGGEFDGAERSDAVAAAEVQAAEGGGERGADRPLPDLPRRRLPHQLSIKPDLTRSARHESGADLTLAIGGEEAIDYGLWWHETMELLPWSASGDAWDAYGEERLTAAAAAGFAERGREEWRRFRSSEVWALLADPRWSRQAEIGVFAPVDESAWVDGVIDLVLQDREADEVWIVDWKTNRRRKGETPTDTLRRLALEYAPQLRAYAACVSPIFPAATVRCWVYSSALGDWVEIRDPE